VKTSFELLGVSDDSSQEEVRQAWRRLAALHHPDRGGDAAKFSALHNAYREALALAAQRLCRVCRGTGSESIQRGFHTLSVPCRACGGSGMAD
jgi:DnaJ-class molecular chaperone